MLDHHAILLPTATRMLANLAAILAKGDSWAQQRGIDPAVLLASRLAPDMYPLVKQVQIVSDTCKGAAARLTGQSAPAFADVEQSFAELQQRLQRTQDYLAGFAAADFADAGARQIVLPWLPEQPLTGDAFLLHFALPNLYFHTSTAYAILRHNGVPLGKPDYLGAL
ncbi:DUF1993 domain-containing protein [Chitinilyticum litopenaei]|uniref:DUF1993 domain-containing protein n=1 Tax=Chitinilyticum litopenaei TaxID=1121276 RepID=UPI00042465C7|nr:DUF1993 domain-containing protein [Chitinilyticum litopenaei]